MTGFEPVRQGLEGPWATVTPHSLWFGLRASTRPATPGNMECFLHTQAEHGPVPFTGPSTSFQFSNTPLMTSCGRQGIRTQALPSGRTGLRPASGPSARTAHWRQRQDSNPDPRALEARMLLYSHAADVTSRVARFEDTTSLWPGPYFFRA